MRKISRITYQIFTFTSSPIYSKYIIVLLLCFFCIRFQQIQAQDLQHILNEKAFPICQDQVLPIPPWWDDEDRIPFDEPLPVCYNAPFHGSINFYRVKIKSGNTFTFRILSAFTEIYFQSYKNPNLEDWDSTPMEDMRGIYIEPAGNQGYAYAVPMFEVGLSLTAETTCKMISHEDFENGETGIVKYYEVQPGDEILIALNSHGRHIYDKFEIEFGGDAILDCVILENNFFKCIDENVSTADFDLEDILPELEEDFPDGDFKFFTLKEDAENDSGTPIAFPFSVDYNNGEPTEIFVRVEDAEGVLIEIVQIYLYLSKYPQLLTETLELEPVCDNGAGVANIDLTQYDELLIDTEDDDIEIRYYVDEDAYQAGNFIENPTSYEVENEQIIIADAVNVFSGCISKDFASLKINLEEKPYLDLSEYDGAVICKYTEEVFDEDLTSIEVETGLSEADYNFTWIYEEEVLPESGADLVVEAGGSYSVIISNKEGIGCEETVSFTIFEQAAPEFEIKATRPAFTAGNGILVYNVSGIGVYVFKVDDGNWQSPNANGTLEFENISPGPHLVYGKDIGGCGELVLPITILGYPNFFTPNEDGINDTWNVIGLEDQSDAVIYIFDRYGKLLTQIRPDREGWDGTFNGKKMPSNEYWFKIEFKETVIYEDGSSNKQPAIYTGHFTLKR